MQVLQQIYTYALSASQDSKKRYCWLYTLEQGTSSSTSFHLASPGQRRSALMHIYTVHVLISKYRAGSSIIKIRLELPCQMHLKSVHSLYCTIKSKIYITANILELLETYYQ